MRPDQWHSMIINFFKFAYFGHVSHDKAIWSELNQYCDNYFTSKSTTQENKLFLLTELVKVVTLDPLAHFPVAKPHIKSTLCWIAKFYLQSDIPTNLREFLSDLENEDLFEPEFIYKTFDRGDSVFVTLLEENREILGHGTTGLTSWQGALFLNDWAMYNQDKLQGKRIFELGSGVGMLGISLLKKIPLKEYYFTDCHHKVLNFLKHNILINLTNLEEHTIGIKALEGYTSEGPPTFFHENDGTTAREVFQQEIVQSGDNICRVALSQLDWLKYDQEKYEKSDVILGSDIVYERTLIQPLCKVIRSLLSRSDSTNPVAFISCTERSRTTIECFETSLTHNHLEFEVVHRGMYAPNEHILCSDVIHQMTKIYKIVLS